MTLNEITSEIQNLSYDDLLKLNKSVIASCQSQTYFKICRSIRNLLYMETEYLLTVKEELSMELLPK